MAATAEQTAASDVTSIVSGFEQVIDRFVSGVERSHPGDLATFPRKSIRCMPPSPRAEPARRAGPADRGRRCGNRGRFHPLPAAIPSVRQRVWRKIFFTLAATIIAVVAGLLAERLLFVQGLSVRTLRLWVLITAMGLLALVGVRSLLMASRPGARASRPPGPADARPLLCNWLGDGRPGSDDDASALVGRVRPARSGRQSGGCASELRTVRADRLASPADARRRRCRLEATQPLARPAGAYLAGADPRISHRHLSLARDSRSRSACRCPARPFS